MEFKDNCAICVTNMQRKTVARLLPCGHIFHQQCVQRILEGNHAACPMCRGSIDDTELCIRKIYKNHSSEDRSRIVSTRGEDWVALSASLGIGYKTAWNWVKSGRTEHKHKGGYKPKLLTEEQIDVILSWVEENCSITLNALHTRIQSEFNIMLARSTVSNYLEGRAYTSKAVHVMPTTMNSAINKGKRADFVAALNAHIQAGKQLVYIDETNFNLFCRHNRGRSKVGNRAVQLLPAARGPNIHLIGAISASGVVSIDRQRGSFKKENCSAWISRVLRRWEEQGNSQSDLVIICYNAPCHSDLENAVYQHSGGRTQVLRMAPYSPMLNAIEIIWGKIKMYVKGHIVNPSVNGPNVGGQRLQYLEKLVDDATATITGGDCARAVQHSSSFHAAALMQEDMPVGT